MNISSVEPAPVKGTDRTTAQSPGHKSPELKSPLLKSPLLKSPELQSSLLQSPELQSPELQSPQLQSPELTSPTLRSEDDDDFEDDDHDILLYQGADADKLNHHDTSVQDSAKIERRFTQEDANSLVGGQQLSGQQLGPKKSAAGNANDNYSHLQKVFSFSLPFGGLSLIRSNFKLPFMHKEEDPEIESLRLKLERQQSVSTLEEAKLFSHLRGTDDVRLRAMKLSIKENLTDFLPDFVLKKEKPYESIYHDISGPILVMGGYRGSILRDTQTGKRVWIPLKAGFNLRKIKLLLGPERDDELNATDYIYPDGILKNIGPFDICKKFIKKIDNGKTTVDEFGYDWRLSLDITRDQLIERMLRLQAKTKQKVIVVAHSMGGLVAHGAMQKRPDLFRGLVYVGTPSECYNILGPVRYGDTIMYSDKILTFETNFMMRSSFSFLPLKGRVFSNKNTGEYYDLDYFDPETWVEYNLNPLVSSARRQLEKEGRGTPDSPSIDTLVAEHHPTDMHHSSLANSVGLFSSRIRSIQTGINRKGKSQLTLTNLQMQKRHQSGRASPSSPVDEELITEYKYSFSFSKSYAYLCDTLKRAKEYVLGLEFDDSLENQYPPLAVVYGNQVPSVRGSYVNSRQDIKDGNYYEFFYGRGDGVVHQSWLMPENRGFEFHDSKSGKGHIVGKFATSAGHVNLMSDFEVMGKALGAIVEADKKWRK